MFLLKESVLAGGPVARILLIDDDQSVLEATDCVLASEGYQVDRAETLDEALAKFKLLEYSLILLDMHLPDGNGLQVIGTFKQLRPQTDVVVMTGFATLETVIESMRAGATDFLIKPFSMDQLCAIIRKALAKREMSQENVMLRVLNSMKDKFLTLVSHELRTPLTLVYGYLTILFRQSASFSPEQSDLLGIVLKSTRQLINIVNNIHMITQAQSGQMQLHLQPLDSRKLVSDVLAEMKASISDRKLEMSMEEGAEVPALQGDSIRLRQALMELLQNAIRNTPDGGSVFTGVAVRENMAVFWVKDTGVGIPVEDQSRIFDGFYEVADVELHSSGSSKFQGGGIGIGLSLVKAVVEAHKGRLRLVSQPGQGTLIEISVPLDLEKSQGALQTEAASGLPEKL